jgi:beta-N-acetylhexosaminidase
VIKKQISFFLLLIFCEFTFFAYSKQDTDKALKEYISSMSTEEKLSQFFLVSILETYQQYTDFTDVIPPGGYILFQYNFTGTPEQGVKLTGEIQKHYYEKQKVPPFFAIDHEGGQVNRLRYIASPLASPQSIVSRVNLDTAYKIYHNAGIQLKALGIQINLSPIAEVKGNHNAEFIGYRTFGRLQFVEDYGKTCINAYRDAGIYSVLKHFPGNTNDDPHYGLPVLSNSQEEINSLYIEPFKQLIKTSNPIGVLMSHAIVSSYEDTVPSCFSSIMVNTILKQKLGFSKLVFSDDVLMKALSQNGYSPSVAIEKAIRAGVHIIMVSHHDYEKFIPDLVTLFNKDLEFQAIASDALKVILETKVEMGLMEYVLKNGLIVLQPIPIEKRYNTVQQVTQFLEAKEIGQKLYNQYWSN